MRKGNATWSEILLGSYVKDRTGKLWKITWITSTRVGLVDADGASRALDRPAGHLPVVTLDTTSAEAVATATTILGATPLEG